MTCSLFKKTLWIGLSLTLYITPSFANTLPNFKTSYYVNAFGVELGKATHEFNCKKEDCTLISRAKPSGVAAMFFSDSSIETIQLKQTKNALTWLKYHKLGTSKKNGKTTQKHTTMKRDEANNQVIFIEKNRTWPLQSNTFDIMSISYAIQYFKLNSQPLKELALYIQDNSFQEKLVFKTVDQKEQLEFNFSPPSFKALKYVFESQQSRIELWLLPDYDYFPGKIRLINKKEDKTITLNLAELPKIL